MPSNAKSSVRRALLARRLPKRRQAQPAIIQIMLTTADAVAGPQHLRADFAYMICRLVISGVRGDGHEKALARRRRAGSATRKPCNGGRLAAHSTNLRSSCSSASRDIQLVDRLLFGRQRGRHLDTSLLHRRLTGRWSRRLHVYTEGCLWRRSAWLPVPVGQLGFRSRGYLVVEQPPTIATKRSSAQPREVHWHRPD